ncbi:MAG: hypothetical protein D6683_03960 [Actinomyces sp.]|nr:MAG: hypothetical protein D6683_03960 [Actinomyces sp.]
MPITRTKPSIFDDLATGESLGRLGTRRVLAEFFAAGGRLELLSTAAHGVDFIAPDGAVIRTVKSSVLRGIIDEMIAAGDLVEEHMVVPPSGPGHRFRVRRFVTTADKEDES